MNGNSVELTHVKYLTLVLSPVTCVLTVVCNADSTRPQHTIVSRKTSTSLKVVWISPLSLRDFLRYEIAYVGVESINPVPNSFFKVTILNSTQLFVVINGLTPYSVYNITVQTITRAGARGASVITARTRPDGTWPFTLL